ncbi:MAG TPA: hypothetical protein VFC84_14720 [Desulfosporosinus sp.]|nr:hypothetical protein [Desulfosporosinus sp.]
MSDIEQRNKEITDRIAARTEAYRNMMDNLRQGYANNNSSEDEEVERLRLQEATKALITKSIEAGTASIMTLLNQGYADADTKREAKEAAKFARFAAGGN